MIRKLKRWIGRVAQQEMYDSNPVPAVVAHGSTPLIQVFKISNGYIISKTNGSAYRDENPVAVYCATPLDVARQIVNGEALQKMGIQPDPMQTTGYASAKLGTQTNPVPTL